MLPTSPRHRFSADALDTASPAKIVVMAFDRLERDLAGAVVAIEAKQIERSHELLVHAQDLVHELLYMLDQDAWEHAPKLASIYAYVIDLLTQANVRKSVKQVAEARTLLADIGDGFRQAATIASVPATPTVPGPAAPTRSAFATPGASASASGPFATSGSGRQSFTAIA